MPAKQQPKMLDTQEVYNLWDTLRAAYDRLQQIQVFQNFVHDNDFSFLLKQTIFKTLEQEINELETQMSSYQLVLPRRPPKSVRTPSNTEAFSDEFIATTLLTTMQETFHLLLRAIRTSSTSDHIRTMFGKYLILEVDLYNQAIKYVKLKGWIGNPPLYPQTPKGTTEQLNTGEAFHLWDHLIARYTSVEVTQLYENYAHDADLAAILLVGLRTVLEKQVNNLEKEMDHFGLPLPYRPPKSVKTPVSSIQIDDILIYRTILTNIQSFFELHAVSLKQSTTNDRLRKIYMDLLKTEISLYDKFLKYGKVKGWLIPVPLFQL